MIFHTKYPKNFQFLYVQSSLDCRANVEQFSRQCFERSVKISKSLDIEVKKPRICWRHKMRDIVEAEGLEDYFRKSITVPFSTMH